MVRYLSMSEFDRILRKNGCERPHRCFPTAVSGLRLRRRTRWQCYPTDGVRDDVAAFVKSGTPLNPLVDSQASRIIELTSDPSIDAGEAYLIDYACSQSESILITGDKRCVVALASNPRFGSILPLLHGRLVHLDCILESICELIGWTRVRARVCADPDADIGLARAIGMNQHETTARTNLGNRIQSLLGDSAGLLRTTF
jgi:hypothetical protein